jgi:hypothetical protein
MPYDVEEHGEKCPVEAESGWDVVNTDLDEVKDHHGEKADAERQERILTEMEKEE